jgi:hypothetical protein
MDQIIRIGMDTSKHVFQLHGVNAAEEPILRKKLRRQDRRSSPMWTSTPYAQANHSFNYPSCQIKTFRPVKGSLLGPDQQTGCPFLGAPRSCFPTRDIRIKS